MLLALADWSNDEGESWYSVRNISEKCRVSERTVQVLSASLTESGFLTITRASGGNYKNTNLYKINVPRLMRGAESSPLTGAESSPVKQLLHPRGEAATAPNTSVHVSTEVQVDKPETFPPNEVEAVSWASTTGCTPEFIKRVWHKANGRGGRDSRDIPIRNWCSHVMTELAYEKNRVEEQKHRASSTPNGKPPPREKDYSSWSKPTPPGRYK